MEKQGQVQHNKIQKSRYNERYKHIHRTTRISKEMEKVSS